MTELKIKALEKMNIEMNEKHNDYEDYIHNMLCDYDDDHIFELILKEGKSIKSCYLYLENYAYKNHTRNGSVGTYAMTPNKIIELVNEYYKSDLTVIEKESYQNSSSGTGVSMKDREIAKEKKIERESKKQNKKQEVKEISIFDFGVK